MTHISWKNHGIDEMINLAMADFRLGLHIDNDSFEDGLEMFDLSHGLKRKIPVYLRAGGESE